MVEEKVIHLGKFQIESFLKFMSLEQSELNEQITELQKRYKDNENTIAQLTGEHGTNGNGSEQIVGSANGSIGKKDQVTLVNPAPKYSAKSSWWEKVVFVLTARSKGTYARDILNFLYELDPEIKGDAEKEKKNAINLFALLSTKVRKGKLKRIRAKGEFFYGLPEWFNEDGRLKENYR